MAKTVFSGRISGSSEEPLPDMLPGAPSSRSDERREARGARGSRRLTIGCATPFAVDQDGRLAFGVRHSAFGIRVPTKASLSLSVLNAERRTPNAERRPITGHTY